VSHSFVVLCLVFVSAVVHSFLLCCLIGVLNNTLLATAVRWRVQVSRETSQITHHCSTCRAVRFTLSEWVVQEWSSASQHRFNLLRTVTKVFNRADLAFTSRDTSRHVVSGTQTPNIRGDYWPRGILYVRADDQGGQLYARGNGRGPMTGEGANNVNSTWFEQEHDSNWNWIEKTRFNRCDFLLTER